MHVAIQNHDTTPARRYGLDALLDADGALAEAEAPLQSMARHRRLSPWEDAALGAILEQRFAIYLVRAAVERERKIHA